MYERSNYMHNRYVSLPSLGCEMKDSVHNGSVVLTPPSVLRFPRKNSFNAVSRPDHVLQVTLVSPLREDHQVQVNTLYIRWDGVTVPGADRHSFYSWHMQQ